jgi:hypothetical protein
MLPNSGENPAQFMALQTLALGDGADDRSQARIVGVRHIREQMMFDLVVETASKPGGEPGGGCEVGGRADLVHSPIVTCANAIKLHARREMRDLEDNRQEPAQNEMKENESGGRPYERQDQEGRQDNQ